MHEAISDASALENGLWFYPYWNIVYRQRNNTIMANEDFLPGALETARISRELMLRFVLTGYPPFGINMFLYQESIKYDVREAYFSDGSVQIPIQINLLADDRDIFLDLSDFLCSLRKRFCVCTNKNNEKFYESCCENNGLCNEIKKHTKIGYMRRSIDRSGDSFRPAHNLARIVGLRLWDEVDTTKISIAEAKRRFVECGYAEELGFGESEYQRFHRVYTATDCCISQAKVLPMS